MLEALATLEAELAGDEGVDAADRETLERMAGDIRERMAAADEWPKDEEPLSGSLQDVVLEFEAEHPKVTGCDQPGGGGVGKPGDLNQSSAMSRRQA